MARREKHGECGHVDLLSSDPTCTLVPNAMQAPALNPLIVDFWMPEDVVQDVLNVVRCCWTRIFWGLRIIAIENN
jgi:hypothetical protein